MQAISGLSSSLGCTDCKTSFSSASLLLKHFAEHISGQATREGSTESESDDTRSESILERALRSPTSLSSGSAPETSVCDDKTTPEQVLCELANNNNNIKPDVMYVKLDLQKRVENCVLQLTDSGESTGEECVKVGEEVEEFNPLKFCVVTLEEGNEKLELCEPPRKTCALSVDPQQQYKKYVCTYCCKRFGWSTDLKRHILTHTGERPFQCQLCGATFTRNFLLQKHMVKLHKPVIAEAESVPTDLSLKHSKQRKRQAIT